MVEALNARADAIVARPDEVAARDWSKHLAGAVSTEIRVTDVIGETPDLSGFFYDVARTYSYRCENALMHFSDYQRTEDLADKRLRIEIKEGWINEHGRRRLQSGPLPPGLPLQQRRLPAPARRLRARVPGRQGSPEHRRLPAVHRQPQRGGGQEPVHGQARGRGLLPVAVMDAALRLPVQEPRRAPVDRRQPGPGLKKSSGEDA
ncbi:hypothetical protein ACRAWD_19925 [Caulobacter segnis]